MAETVPTCEYPSRVNQRSLLIQLAHDLKHIKMLDRKHSVRDTFCTSDPRRATSEAGGGGSEPLLELETLTEASGPHPAESGTSKESGAKRWRKRQRVRRAKTLPTTFGGKL